MTDYMRIAQAQRTGGKDFDVLPDAGVAVADSRNPVPSLGCDEGRPVDGHGAAVVAGTGRYRLFVRYAGVRRRRNAHRDRVALPRAQDARDVEPAADKGAADGSEAPAVQPYLRRVVDALEEQ